MRRQKGSVALIVIVVVLIVVALAALFLVYGSKLTGKQSASPGTPTSETTQSGSYLQEKYDNPFDEKSQYSNPFDESDSYTNPFDSLQ